MTCRQFNFPKDAMHQLMDLGQIVLVDGKLMFRDEEQTRKWLRDDIDKAAAEGGYIVPLDKLVAAVIERLRKQMSE